MNAPEPDSEETQRLLRQGWPGDRDVFDRLFERHRAYLREAIDMRLDPRMRRRVDASDVVQEAQLDAFQRLGDYLARRPMPFRLWLRKTAQERLIKLREQHIGAARRAAGRETRTETPLPDRSSMQLVNKLMDGGSTPSQAASRKELAARVRRIIARMDDADREILLLRSLEGLSYVEVGHIIDIDPAAARKRHARSLVRLHEALLDDGLTESQI